MLKELSSKMNSFTSVATNPAFISRKEEACVSDRDRAAWPQVLRFDKLESMEKFYFKANEDLY